MSAEYRRRWDRPYATTRDTRGPERVEVGEPDPRGVGFTAAIDEPEPLTWEGDQS